MDSGDAISTWLDLSGNGNNAGQLTSTKVPDLSSDASKQNGKHIISFTGTDEFEIPDDATLRVGEQNYGIFVVVKKTGSNTQYIFAKGRAGYNGANYRRYVASLTDSSFTHEIDEDPQWYAVNSSGTYQNEYKVIYTERNSGYLNTYVDGDSFTSTALPSGYGSLDENNPTSFLISGKPWGSTTSSMDLAEFTCLKALTDDERASVSTYLSTKWA